jgi:hypothetical protein
MDRWIDGEVHWPYVQSLSRACAAAAAAPPPPPHCHVIISSYHHSSLLSLSYPVISKEGTCCVHLVKGSHEPWSHRVICVVIKLLLLVDVAAVRSKARSAAYQSTRVRIAVEQRHSSTSILFSRLLCYDNSSGCTICCGTLPASLLVDDSSSSSS